MVSDKDTEYLLTLDPDKDITRTLIISLMCRTAKNPPKYKRNEPLVIPKGRYKNNKEPIKTTLGKLIYNRFVLEEFYDLVGYVNKPVTKKVYEGIADTINNALLEDEVTTHQVAKFLDKNAFFYGLVSILAPSFTKGALIPNKRVMAKRAELVKKYAKEIEDGDAIVGTKIEHELLKIAAEELKNDPVGELFESGASKLNLDNSYKNMKIMKGPIMDAIKGKFVVSTSNFTEGIRPDEIPAYANVAVAGAYARGKSTQIGGYITKQYYAAFPSIILDKAGSDCGTKLTTTVKVDPKKHKFRYVMVNGKPTLLNVENLKKYAGQVMQMRTPIYCKSEKICNKCAGDLYYKIDIKYAGLTLSRLSNSVMNAALKKSHDVTVHVYRADINDIVL